MSYNGTGTFVINTTGQPVVTGTVISSSVFNALTSDLATGLSTAITKDGQTTITNNIPFSNNKITGLGVATTSGDALSYGQAATVSTLTVSSTATLSNLTASTALALDVSKNIVSVTNTGSGNNVLATSPTLVTPVLGTPTSGMLTNCTGLPVSSGVSGLGTGVATALAVNTGSAGAFVVNGGALGTPSSGTVTNLTGTASININGTVGATTPAAGTFTSLSDSGNLTFTGTGNRITGDFSNATIANRVMFQSSTANGNTIVTVIPNGTGTAAAFMAQDNAAPNASVIQVRVVSGSDGRIESGIHGSGTYLPITLYTAGLERMRIDTSGNVGIGTSSPAGALSVYRATGSAQWAIQTLNNVNTGGSGFWQRANGSHEMVLRDASNNANYITNQSNDLEFVANGSERMRIDSSGNLLVGTTSTLGGKLSIKTSGETNAYLTNDTAGGYIIDCDAANNGGTYYFINFRKTGTGISNITSNGTTVAYNTGSDYRLKDNIQPIKNALETVAKLKPSTWDWKKFYGSGSSQGFVAHELQAVVPDCVTGEKDEIETYIDEKGVEQIRPKYQGVDTSFLVATLTAAIQELKAELDATKAEIAALKGA